MKNRQHNHSANDFSLSFKFIFVTLTLEWVFLCGGLFFAYQNFYQEMEAETGKALLSQVNFIAKEWSMLQEKQTPPPWSELTAFNPKFAFQILDRDAHLLWDSKNSKRIHTQLLGTNPLFDEAKVSNQEQKILHFKSPLNSFLFLGAYHQDDHQDIVIGATPLSEIERSSIEATKKLFAYALFFFGFSFCILACISIHFTKIAIQNSPLPQKEFPPAPALAPPTPPSLPAPPEPAMPLLSVLQKSLLPPPEIRTARYEIQSYYQPSLNMGGDTWGHFETHDNLYFYFGEAKVNGIKSALLASTIRGCFATLHRLIIDQPELKLLPSQILSYLNTAIMENIQEDFQIALFAASYSFPEQILSYANAGHPHAWVFRNRVGESKLEVLKSHDHFLGETRDYEPPENHQITLSENDILFLHTQGLLNCANEHKEAYGKDRVRNLMTDTLEFQLNLLILKEALVKDMRIFTEKKPQKDDITLALFKLRASWERNDG